MNKNKQAFSMVELIIAVSIVIILSAIAVTTMESSKDKSNNSKILSDVETLNNGFKSYAEETKDLPQPKGNLQYYGEDTGYRHDYETAFGVSGYVTQDVLPAKYMNNLPLDPKTGQYYGYARTKNTVHFEVAGVMFDNNAPKAKVSGNWTGEFGPYNLVKEYAGPNFVYDNATDFFPYNPYEKMLVAKVSSYTGGVLKINGRTYTDKEILEYNLGEGDTIEIGTGGMVDLFFSDGSNSVLGDTVSDSKVTLQNMKFVENTNLYTSIKLALNMGSLWTKASKMSDKSEFEVYTSDAVAAVRGTIFGLQKGNLNSDVVVQQGKVQIKEKTVSSELPVNDTALVGAGIVHYDYAQNKSYIEVQSGSGAKGVVVNTRSTNTSGTGALGFLTVEGSGIVIENIPELNQNQQIEVEKFNQYSASGFDIKFGLQKSYKKAQYLKITNDTATGYYLYNSGAWAWGSYTGTLNIPNTVTLYPGNKRLRQVVDLSPERKVSFAFCSIKNGKERCSRSINLFLKDQVSYDIQNKKMVSCEKDLDEIYQKFFAKPILRPACKAFLGIDGWSEKTKEQKENIVLNFMNDNNCYIYQQNNGVLDGTGFMNCKSSKVAIGNQKIVNGLAGKGYNLVAYAPYDNDVSMNTSGSALSVSHDSISGVGYMGIYSTGTNLFPDTPTTYGDTLSAGLSNLGFDFSREPVFAIYKWGDFGKGIFLDNNGTNDKLKYDGMIGNLGLSHTGYFAVETSVRGAALKRTTGNYTLFQIGSLQFGKYGLNLGTRVGADSSHFSDLNSIISTLENNKFYRVVLQYSNGKNQVFIYDNNKLLAQSSEQLRLFTMDNYLYVGVYYDRTQYVNQYVNQWNDIIDYVKIYKKPTVTLTQIKTILGQPTLSTEKATSTFERVAVEAQ